jgi:putative acetyltransferase
MPEILIRRADPSDAQALARIYSSPSVVWGTLQLPYGSVQLWQKRLEFNDEHFLYVAVIENEVVGSIGLHLNPTRPRRKHVAGIGMGVRDDWQGKGVGTALMQAVLDLADKWLNITRIELEVFTDNEPAIRLYKKFGFEIEGTLRRHAFRDGEYVDSYYMARLKQGNS